MATTNPTPAKSELEVAVRARLGLGPDVEDEAVLVALDEALAGASPDPEPAPPALEPRTIRHGLFSYDLPDGGGAIAFRGATVDLLPHDIERGEKFEAFTPNVGDLPDAPTASTLPALAEDASESEADAWVQSGSVQEILDAVNTRPETLTAVIEAEQRRGDAARTTLLTALAKMNASA